MHTKAVIGLASATLLLVGCSRATPPKDSKQAAERLSELAKTPAQAQLWKEAAEKGTAAGIGRLPVPERPVATRKRVTPPSRTAVPQRVSLPPGVEGAVRIVAAPELEAGSFSGLADVVHIEGERIDLDLGQKRLLTFYARARGGPIQTKVGEKAQVDYRVRDDPFDRLQILAVKSPGGDGIVSVLEGATKPVTVQVPLFRLVASQVGNPDKGSMSVDVRVGETRKTLMPGQIAEFPGLTVGLLASSAYVGSETYRVEGNPYSIDLVAWPSRQALPRTP